MTKTAATILSDTSDFDALTTWNTIKVTSKDLREGMLLVDDLGTAVAALDHRNGSIGSGIVEWLVEDLENGGWTKATFPVSRKPSITVAAGLAD